MTLRIGVSKLIDSLRSTPLHPQWLLGTNVSVGRWVAAGASGKILDVGCGTRWVQKFLSIEADYLGLDFLATGRDLYASRPHIFGDASGLPILDSKIDTLVLLEVLEHLRYPNQALREAARVLSPGGRLLLSIPFLYPIHDAPHDFQRLTRHGIVRDVEAAGFRIEELAPTLGSAETAGLLCCLNLGGMSLIAWKQRNLASAGIPFLILAIPFVNIIAWLLGKIFPSWIPLVAGYRLTAVKK